MTVHNCYTIQHRTVLIISPLILQMIVTAQMLSNGGEEDCIAELFHGTNGLLQR